MSNHLSLVVSIPKKKCLTFALGFRKKELASCCLSAVL